MDENKTGVWIQDLEGRTYTYKEADGTYKGIVGDAVIVGTSSMIATFRIENISYQKLPFTMINYQIKPMYFGKKDNYIWKSYDCSDAKPIEMFLRDGTAVIIVPFDYDKSQYRTKSISSDEAMITFYEQNQNKMETILFGEPTAWKTYPLQTMNEDLEIHTGTILADEIKIGTLAPPPLSERRVSTLPHYQQKPITATSEAEKNWWKECCGGSETERGLRADAPTHIDWNGEMSATLTFSPKKIDEIMNKLAGNEEEKDMYTEKLKDKIKKVIYVDKEMTVREPVLDSNGKPLERGGKPVTKAKFYRGMVKVVWNCGTETVAYTSRFDRFNREEGFKTCVLKYLFGNADTHDAVDFWTNKYVKYPSSCIEVTENLCKLEEILEKDKRREEERKGLLHAKFLRRTTVDCIAEFSSDKVHYTPSDSKLANEFKKLVKKYFPELKGKEIYINDNKNGEVFVAIK
jgi:hypothetical protein